MTSPIVVLTGPSGVGKGTLQRRLLERFPTMGQTVSATTRAPRPGEVEGRDYYFLSREQFARTAAEGGFIEHAVYAGEFYGTPHSEIQRLAAEGEPVLIEIEVQGAAQLRQRLGEDACFVFLAPPSLEELRQRLAGRGTESQAQVAARLSRAETELARAQEFDRVVVNADIDAATEELVGLVHGLMARVAA